MRVVRVAAAVAVALLFSALPAQAAYDDLGFTTVFTDPDEPETVADADIRELAIGEPGDGTLVFRVTVSGNQIPGAAGSIDIFFAGGFRNGWDMDGACDAVFSAGAVSGNMWYCALSYKSAGVDVGQELTGILLRSYVGIVQDYAPGGTPAATASGSGAYLLVGCTLLDPVACPGAAVSPSGQSIEHENLTAPLWNGTFDGADGVRVLNFTTDLVNSTASFAWNGTGSMNATLRDGNGTVVFNGTLEGNGTLSHPISNATAGAWNLTLRNNGFTGNLTFALSAPSEPPVPEATDDQPEEPHATGNETVDEAPASEAPLPALVPLTAVLGAAVLLRRRR